MKLEDQTVSLPLAKRLKELGAKQEGLFVWVPWIETPRLREDYRPPAPRPFDMDLVAAFTVAELGALLPCGVYSYKFGSGFRALADGELWSREGGVTLEGRPFYDASTEADARSKMLIYLLEKGLVKAEENAKRAAVDQEDPFKYDPKMGWRS